MFLEKLIIEKEIDLGLEGCEIRQCRWLNVGVDIFLSVQASGMHYCIPREFIDLSEYTHFELALIKDYELCYDIDMLSEFPRYEQLKSHFDGGVFVYVPRDLISDLYLWCLTYFKREEV